MFSRILSWTTAGIGLLFISQIACAYQLDGDYKYNRFFVDLGGGAYYLNPPAFGVGSSGTSSNHLAKNNNDGFTPIGNIGLGYQFCNGCDNWLTKIFGHENSVELKGGYYNKTSTESAGALTGTADIGAGGIWLIDGSNELNASDVAIYGWQLKAKNRGSFYNAYFKGEKLISKTVSVTPFVGLTYNDFHSEYNSRINYDGAAGPTTRSTIDAEDYDLNFRYFGVTGGGQFKWLFCRRLALTTTVELQLLHAEAKLNASQDADEAVPYAGTEKKIETSDSRALTYTAIVAVGINYYIFNKPDSSYISLQVGADYWDYMPQIVNRTSSSSPAAHLHGVSVLNGFVGASLHVPLF
jgi:hypothetical protein